jgi:hypothetical protein
MLMMQMSRMTMIKIVELNLNVLSYRKSSYDKICRLTEKTLLSPEVLLWTTL